MKPRVSVITVGVDDLEASLKFYRDGLGLPTEGIVGKEFEHGAVVFFELQHGVKLALFSRANLALDAGIPVSGRSPTEFSLGQMVASERAVDAVLRRAVDAGARLVKPGQKTFWGGYAGYFQDPDDHLWEIIFHPSFSTED
jgi:catechol 2,3-dioxygenase-like lactoylglutathione lyase family enzyme